MFTTVASVAARYTSTPNRAWFAVWEGHGFDVGNTPTERPNPAFTQEHHPTPDHERAAPRDEHRLRKTPIAATLEQIPRFKLTNRAYYLMEGPVTAIDGLRYPGDDGWRNPDLLWPDDHRWFVATDVDFWSLYVGGDNDLVAELANSVRTYSQPIGLNSRLEIEN